MPHNKNDSLPGFGEFVALMALMTSMVALAIDAMLPALGQIGAELGASGENDRQQVLTVLFLGLGLGQIVYGPVSDSVGRKRPIYIGFILFLAGTVICALSTDFNTMLIGRFLQGIGAAGPRIVSMALVRDLYEGRAMAKVMSLIMMVFILVPALAPGVGQVILTFADWRGIFVFFFLLAVASLVWFWLRLPETLPVESRTRFSLSRVWDGVLEVCTHQRSIGYTLAAGTIFGAFLGFLNSAQQIMQEQYGLGEQFPLYFAFLALSIGFASWFNSKLVERLGMRHLAWRALLGVCVFSLGYILVAALFDGQPPFWSMMLYLIPTFFCVGILFGNFNSLAMEPLGHIAGVAAAVIGSISTLMSLPLGMLIGGGYNGTVIPLVSGFAVLGLASAGLMWWAEKGRAETV